MEEGTFEGSMSFLVVTLATCLTLHSTSSHAGLVTNGAMDRGEYSEPVIGCLKDLNNEVVNGITLEECKSRCSAATSYACNSMDYNTKKRRCHLSAETKQSRPNAYHEPCYTESTESLYLERKGEYSAPVIGCLKDLNNEVVNGITLEECKSRCSASTSYACNSMDYNTKKRRCHLSAETKQSRPNAYHEPCYTESTENLYLERKDIIPTSTTPVPRTSITQAPTAAPSQGGEYFEPVKACLKYHNNEVLNGITFEECKSRCSSATSYVCNSIEYNTEERKCHLSTETKKSQPNAYHKPCYIDPNECLYLERKDSEFNGYCLTSGGYDQNNSTIELNAGDKNACYLQCKVFPQATGCEWHKDGGCISHIQDVATGNGSSDYKCWVFNSSPTRGLLGHDSNTCSAGPCTCTCLPGNNSFTCTCNC